MNNTPLSFNGYKVIGNELMVVDGNPIYTVRTWKERLFTRPWHPFRRLNKTIPKVPSTQVIMTEDSMIMHPTLVEYLRNSKNL